MTKTKKTFVGATRSRALAAYYRSGGTAQQAEDSGEVEHDGKLYVELHNINGTLAVYRVLPHGALKRLKRWPAEVAAPLDR